MCTFLRNIIDEDTKNTRRTRKRVHLDDKFASDEKTAPMNAPIWARAGYNGILKSVIKNFLSPSQEKDNDEEKTDEEKEDENEKNKEEDDENDNIIEVDSSDDNDEEEDSEESEKESEDSKEQERNERSKSLLSEEYESD